MSLNHDKKVTKKAKNISFSVTKTKHQPRKLCNIASNIQKVPPELALFSKHAQLFSCSVVAPFNYQRKVKYHHKLVATNTAPLREIYVNGPTREV